MYGMEDNKGRKKFMFDLEKDIEENPKRRKELFEKAASHAHALKTALREGANETEFEQLGILLHGYTALQKVLKKATQ